MGDVPAACDRASELESLIRAALEGETERQRMEAAAALLKAGVYVFPSPLDDARECMFTLTRS